jgi:hypothetical protein
MDQKEDDPSKPTVSLAKNSLVYFISIAYIDHPGWRGHREEAKRADSPGFSGKISTY